MAIKLISVEDIHLIVKPLDVIVQMFEWTWDSVATECTQYIGPAYVPSYPGRSLVLKFCNIVEVTDLFKVCQFQATRRSAEN